jgi:hypothetical protein
VARESLYDIEEVEPGGEVAGEPGDGPGEKGSDARV